MELKLDFQGEKLSSKENEILQKANEIAALKEKTITLQAHIDEASKNRDLFARQMIAAAPV